MQKALKNYILNMLAKLLPEEKQEVIGYFLDSELSDEQVCVIVGLDRDGNSISKIACHGRPSAVDVNDVFRMNEDGEINLYTDKHPSLGKYANMNKFKHIELNLSKNIRVIKNIYHIQNVNGYHSRLRDCLRRFKGVAIKYLDNYLSWFDFVDRVEKDVKKKPLKDS